MSNRQVLVADRDPLQRQLVDMLFAVDGFEVVGVDTGRAALEYLKGATPVLAILALELPDIGGVSICSRMRSVTRLSSVPVILVTEASDRLGIDEGTRALARDAGAGLLLQKPLGDKNIRERALRLIEGERPQFAPTPIPESGRSDLHTTQVLVETLQQIDDGAPLDVGARIATLEAENRTLRDRVARLEAELQAASATRDDGSAEERDRGSKGSSRRRS